MIPVAEKAIETGSPEALMVLLSDPVRTEVKRRFEHMTHLKAHVDATREYVSAMLGLQVYLHSLAESIKAEPHVGHHAHG